VIGVQALGRHPGDIALDQRNATFARDHSVRAVDCCQVACTAANSDADSAPSVRYVSNISGGQPPNQSTAHALNCNAQHSEVIMKGWLLVTGFVALALNGCAAANKNISAQEHDAWGLGRTDAFLTHSSQYCGLFPTDQVVSLTANAKRNFPSAFADGQNAGNVSTAQGEQTQSRSVYCDTIKKNFGNFVSASASATNASGYNASVAMVKVPPSGDAAVSETRSPGLEINWRGHSSESMGFSAAFVTLARSVCSMSSTGEFGLELERAKSSNEEAYLAGFARGTRSSQRDWDQLGKAEYCMLMIRVYGPAGRSFLQ
jgi:hypothetical protein